MFRVLSGKTVQTHGEQLKMIEQYLKATENVKNNLYVDDCFGGAYKEDEVIKLQQQHVGFFQTGGWKLTKFASNSKRVMETIEVEDQLPGVLLDFDDGDNDYG